MMTEFEPLAIEAALIIPALNEEAVICQTLDAIPSGLYRLIIVADNGSSDRTAELAAARGATVVSEPRRGYGGACLTAIAALPAGIDAVVFMQADNSEVASEAHLLLAPIARGEADLVLGSRVLGKSEPGALLVHQKFGNQIATTLIRWIWGRSYTDLGPFRAISTSKLKLLDMRDRNYGWTVEMQVQAIRQNLRVLEVPVSYRLRAAGENKVSGNIGASAMAGLKIIWVIFRLWFESLPSALPIRS